MVALLIVLKIFPSRKLILMELCRVARSQPQHTLLLTIFFTFGVIHVLSPVLNLASQWGREEYMPIRPVAEQIGERFGRFGSAVRTSFPLPFYLIFTLTPAPAGPTGSFSSIGEFSPIHASPSDAAIIQNMYALVKVWGCIGVVGL